MSLKVYLYNNCGTCRKAVKFLEANGIHFISVPIRETPPTKAELERMLEIHGGNLRKLFNTSGQDYKRLNLKATLARLSTADAIELLQTNGNLVRRPFVVSATGGVVGFNEEEWRGLLAK